MNDENMEKVSTRSTFSFHQRVKVCLCHSRVFCNDMDGGVTFNNLYNKTHVRFLFKGNKKIYDLPLIARS